MHKLGFLVGPSYVQKAAACLEVYKVGFHVATPCLVPQRISGVAVRMLIPAVISGL